MTKYLLFTALFALAACHKSDSGPTIDFGNNDGFSHRDANNMPNGTQDATDWTTDANWSQTEQNLFASLHLSLTGSQADSSDWRIDFFPNSCALGAEGRFRMEYERNVLLLPTNKRISIAIVDAHYNLLDSFDFAINTGPYGYEMAFQPRFDTTKYSPLALYRMYYVLYEAGQQVYYRGHGDIRLEK